MTSLLIPEGILILTALLTVFVGVLGDQKWQRKIVIVPILGLSLAFLGSILATRPEASDVLSKTLILDSVSQFLKVIFILVALAVIVIGHLSREIEQQYKNEFYSLIILATLASCIIASAVHLLTLYMAYEMASLIFCLLCAFKRESSLTSEASMKLLVIGVATSLFFLLGLVLFFGLTQSLNILDIRAFIEKSQPSNLYLIVALGLIFVAIATRMSLFPFHLAGPDFIDGASVPTAAYLAVGPFLIGVVLALRICFHILSTHSTGTQQWIPIEGLQWPWILSFMAAISMTISNLAALHQDKLKRLFGYAAISQISYILLGFVVANQMGLSSILFGSLTYVMAMLGAFLVSMQAMDQRGEDQISVLRGMVWRHPFEATALTIFILSLSGMPPFAGFVSRVYLIGVVVKERMYWLALVAAFNSVIGLAIYFKVLRLIFERIPQTQGDHKEPPIFFKARTGLATIVALLVPTTFLGVYWDPLFRYISNSLNNILW